MVLSDFRCAEHGVFEKVVDSDDDTAPCPRCGGASAWVPVPIKWKLAIEATRGKSDVPEHRGWLDTSHLEEGQDPEEFQADRDKVHEELRKELVMDMVRSDR